MPRPQHIIIKDLIFVKHRINDWKQQIERAACPDKWGNVVSVFACQCRLNEELEKREVLIEELCWEDVAALDERLVLASKDVLTPEETQRLAELNRIIG